MKTNQEYFDYSRKTHKTLPDFSKSNGIMMLSSRKGENTALMRINHRLTQLIDEYDSDANNISKDRKDEILGEIFSMLLKEENINYTPFAQYFKVLSYSYGTFVKAKHLSVNERLSILEGILKHYIANRHYIYLEHGYSDIVLQVMSDDYSSRRQGGSGIDKIDKILIQLGFDKANDLERYSNNYYFFPDKDGKRLLDPFCQKNHINFQFKKDNQNKYPDVVIVIDQHILIVEHKLTNSIGGAQNQEINELIRFIDQKENSSNVHYIAFLQGDYIELFNEHNLASGDKITQQYNHIVQTLKKEPNNFFVDENGFASLVNDLKK
jgi:hypothetical protein